MSAPLKPEFPPLLPGGFHEMSTVEIRQLCVTSFPLSSTRSSIMNGLEAVVRALSGSGITGDLWVDGSFMTQKIDPNDVDLVLRVRHDLYDNGTVEQTAAIE